MQHPLDYHTPHAPKTTDGRRADIAAIILLLVTGAIVALLACGGSFPSGLCAALPFALIGTVLAIAGVRERRGTALSVTVLICNAMALPLSVRGLLEGLAQVGD